MDGSLLGATIQASLAPWSGPQMPVFAKAIGNGIVMGLKGTLQFQTMDTGTITGFGMGVGLGIKGVQNSQMSSLMFDKGQSYWSSHQKDGPGTQWKIFCDKISLAVKTHLMTTAILKSQHPVVFVGAGKVVKYFGISSATMKGAIVSAAPGSWAKGRFPELADAVATGVVGGILQHSPLDLVAIVGSPSIPIPVAGVGNGIGIVT